MHCKFLEYYAFKQLQDLPKPEIWDKEENLVPMFGNDNLLWLLESYMTEDESIVEKNTPDKKIAKLINESKRSFIDGVR